MRVSVQTILLTWTATYSSTLDQSDREIYGLDGLDSEDELSDDDIIGKNEDEEEIDGRKKSMSWYECNDWLLHDRQNLGYL